MASYSSVPSTGQSYSEALAEFAAIPQLSTLEEAILRAVAYADIFDSPLTMREIHRYLVHAGAPIAAIQEILDNGRLVPRYLSQHDGYFFLTGRGATVVARREQRAGAAVLWPRAIKYGMQIARLPFVRMVAVTGGLAVDNVNDNTDIDFLIVAEAGRLWLCRALVIALVRIAARRGDIICPNYFLSERALVVHERNLFTAHELAQMVPVAGLDTYYRIRQLNRWTEDFLPNASGPPRLLSDVIQSHAFGRKLVEAVLRTPIGQRLEQWEMDRKIRKFTRQRNDHTEACFSADCCKGHFDGHGGYILALFADRLRKLGLHPG